MVTFWTGDATNSSYGPYPLSMDFNANVSKTSLQYTYTSTGTYTAAFLVQNALGSRTFNLQFQVVMALYGFFITVNPTCVQPNQPVTISAYIQQGVGVTYNWNVNNALQYSAARTG
jgi:hypothetical protein